MYTPDSTSAIALSQAVENNRKPCIKWGHVFGCQGHDDFRAHRWGLYLTADELRRVTSPEHLGGP